MWCKFGDKPILLMFNYREGSAVYGCEKHGINSSG